MCNQAVKRQRTLIIPTDSAKNQYSLKNDEILRDAKRIVAIEAYRVGTVSIAPDGTTTVSDTIFNKASLTLETSDGTIVLTDVPLTDLCKADNNGQKFLVNIPPIVPSKCFIKVASPAGLSITEAFVIGFEYEM
jgi:hypothetical protein